MSIKCFCFPPVIIIIIIKCCKCWIYFLCLTSYGLSWGASITRRKFSFVHCRTILNAQWLFTCSLFISFGRWFSNAIYCKTENQMNPLTVMALISAFGHVFFQTIRSHQNRSIVKCYRQPTNSNSFNVHIDWTSVPSFPSLSLSFAHIVFPSLPHRTS